MLMWTALTPETTVQWAALTNLLAEFDDTGEIYSSEDLAEELEEADFDREHDSWAVWDGQTLVAYGQLRVSQGLLADGDARADLSGGVHPRWRGQGVGTQLLSRMEPRALELASERHPNTAVQLRTGGGREGSDARPLLSDFGYQPARYFTDMRRPLPGEPLAAVDPRVQPFTSELSEAVRLAHNDAFTTHWGSAPLTPRRWADVVDARSFRARESCVVLGDEGEVLAYALCGQWVDRELYIQLVGARQAARGQGLGRAVLQATITAAATSGDYDLIDLDVDSANPSGAGALYQSVGFTPVRAYATMVKRVEP